jgi:hypothetical protein
MINAGGAENDVAAVALVLATVAFLLHRPRWTPAHLVLAGLAAGLAISVKLPVLPIVGVTVVLALAVMPRASRTRAGAVFAGSVLVTGSYWYVRNLVRTGSPLSSVSLVVFPSASFAIVDRFGYSVADYLRHPGLARDVLPPLVHFAWGPAWLLTFGLAGAGAVVAAIDRDRLLRVLGVASLVAVAVWLVTPTTALGEFGQPLLFPSNSRYVAPAVALAVGATNGTRASWVTDQLLGGLVVGVVAVAALWALRGPAVSRSVAAAVAVAGVGWFVLTGTSHRADAVGLARWAESIPPAHIGVESGVVTSWFLYGDHLANTVEPVGVTGPHGAFHFIDDCTTWRKTLRDRGYDYLVVTHDLDRLFNRDLAGWIASDPGLHQILETNGAFVYQIDPTQRNLRPSCRRRW